MEENKTLLLEARLVDVRHKEWRIKVAAILTDLGLYLPIKAQKNGISYELVRVSPEGIVLYSQHRHLKKHEKN